MSRKIKLQNVFYESELNYYLERDKQRLGLKTRSGLLRKILKERYGICNKDTCTAPANSSGYCLLHKNLTKKEKNPVMKYGCR